MYRILLSIKYDIKELLTKVDRLENHYTEHESRLVLVEEHTASETDEVLWDFPITTLHEVMLFEEKVLEKTFRSKMVIILLSEFN